VPPELGQLTVNPSALSVLPVKNARMEAKAPFLATTILKDLLPLRRQLQLVTGRQAPVHLLKDVPMVNPGVAVSALNARLVTTALIQQVRQFPALMVQTAIATVCTTLITVLLATLVLPESEPRVVLERSLLVQLLPVPTAHQATCALPLIVLLKYAPVELSQKPLLSLAPSALPLVRNVRVWELLTLLLSKQIAVLATTEYTLVELSLLTDA
jgi:hypothetical protein